MSKKGMSRRKFLQVGGCGAIGSLTFLSTCMNLQMANALSSYNMEKDEDDYKALVCILLGGGNDSFNMLVPNSNTAYNEYAAARSNLALSHGSLLPLNYTDVKGKSFGLHPSMPEVQQLFNNGKLSFISNVGTLTEPITKAQYLNNSVRVPIGLFSHADQIQQWQTSLPQSRSARGWGGKMADILSSMNDNQNISMNVSLSGTNVFQAGNNTIEYAITNSKNGSVGINVMESQKSNDQILAGCVNSLMGQQYQDIYKKTFVDKIKHSVGSHKEFSSAIEEIGTFSSQFSNNDVSLNMQMIAKTIAARKTLRMKRQTFFVLYGGWDHHDEVLNNQVNMLGVVSKALGEFQATMEELNIADKVTTFTISDFGRSLASNSNGTDHGWGGNAIVMGGSVNGKKIYGEYPSLASDSAQEFGNGILLPTISTDEYFAELAMWLGVQNNNLTDILPNLENFHNIGSGNPIGFTRL